VAFPLSGRPFGQKALAAITDGDLEAFMAHLHADGYTVSSRNKFIQTIKALFRWATKKGYVMRNPALDSDALKRGKPAKRTRRLEPRRRGQPAEAREPAPTTADHRGVGDRVSQGELLKLQWRDVSLTRRLITIQTAKAKTKTSRDIPISARLAGVLEMGKTDPMGKNFEADDYVFGDALGRPITDIKKAWETCVLKAHGQTPSWDRRNALSPASCQAYRTTNLTFHDLRHEAGSRLLEFGWSLRQVKDMLGHANVSQTDTYLNATKVGLQEAMRRLDSSRCNPVARKEANRAGVALQRGRGKRGITPLQTVS
jgi:site-specific recombinase XerD